MIVDILWVCHASSCQRNVQQILEEEIPVTINMTSFLLVSQNSCVFVACRGVYYLTLNSAILYSLSWLKSCAETHIPGVTQHAGVQAQTRAYITLGNVISNGTSLWIRRDLAWPFYSVIMDASLRREVLNNCMLLEKCLREPLPFFAFQTFTREVVLWFICFTSLPFFSPWGWAVFSRSTFLPKVTSLAS